MSITSVPNAVYESRVKTAIRHLQGVGVPLDPEIFTDLWHKYDAELQALPGLGDEDKRTTHKALRRVPLDLSDDGKIHAGWSTCGTTGRLQSYQPAITSLPKVMRACLRSGKPILTADWSASHPTILAQLSGDDHLKADLASKDFYLQAASYAQQSAGEAVDRKLVKADLLTLFNGGRVHPAVAALFAPGGRYEKAAEYIKQVAEEARDKGRVTYAGHTYPADAARPHAAIGQVLQRAEVAALMRAIEEALEEKSSRDLPATLILAVHDELVFELDDAEPATVEKAQRVVSRIMREAMQAEGMANPPAVKTQVGWSWAPEDQAAGLAGGSPPPPPPRREVWVQRGLDLVKAGDTSRPTVIHLAALHASKPAWTLAVEAAPAKNRKALRALKQDAHDLSRVTKIPVELSSDPASPVFETDSQAYLAQRLVDALGGPDHVVYDGDELYVVDRVTGLWQVRTGAQVSKKLQSWEGARVGEESKLRVSAALVQGVRTLAQDRVTDPACFGREPTGVALGATLLLSDGTSREIQPGDRLRDSDVLDVEHDPDAECPRWLRFLEEVWADEADLPERMAYLQEWMGAALWGEATKHRGGLPVLVGEGENGKSVLVGVIQSLFPAGLQSSIELASLGGDRSSYYAAALYGKLLNAVTDLSKKYVADTGLVKAALTGEKINARPPAGTPFDFIPRAAWIFAINRLPPVSDDSDGFWSRLQVITFKKRFQRENRDIHLGAKLRAERAGIVLWAREGLERLARQRGYTVVPSSAGATAEWRCAGDSVASYVVDFVRADEAVPVHVSPDALYFSYKTWADRNGLKACSSQVFSKRFSELTGAHSKVVRLSPTSTGRIYEVMHLDLGEVAGFKLRPGYLGESVNLPGGSLCPPRTLVMVERD